MCPNSLKERKNSKKEDDLMGGTNNEMSVLFQMKTWTTLGNGKIIFPRCKSGQS